jgi:Zn-dependent protease with chaperone function
MLGWTISTIIAVGITLWPTYRLQSSIEEAEDLVKAFHANNNWTINNAEERGDAVRLSATANKQPHWFGPARATWHLRRENDATIIQLQLRRSVIPLIATLLAMAASLAFQLKAILFGVAPEDWIPIMPGAVALLWWTAGGHCAAFFQGFRKATLDATGYPAVLVHNSSPVASPALLNPFIAGELGIFLTAICQPEAAVIRNAGFALSMIPCFVLIAALAVSKDTNNQLYSRTPYFIGIIALVMYTAWPKLDEYTRSDANHATISALTYCLLAAFTLFFLWLAAKVLKNLARTERPADINPSPPEHRRSVRASVTGSILLLWIVAVTAQTIALRSIISRLTSHSATVLDWVWATPLIAAYAALAVQRIRTTNAFARDTSIAPPALTARCRELAILNDTGAPIVHVVDGTASYARPGLFGAPAVCLSAAALRFLDHDEQDALILHELHHARHHSGLLAVLETISLVTLCGRGITTILLDPRQAEFDADQAAVRGLDRLGIAGEETVSAMIGKLAAMRFTNNTTTAPRKPGGIRLVADLFFGDGSSWYCHPSMDERLTALGTPCPR